MISCRFWNAAYNTTFFTTPPDVVASVNSGTTAASNNAQCYVSSNLNASFTTIDNSTYTYYVEVSMTNFVQVMSVEIDH